MTKCDDIIKNREIYFTLSTPDQAVAAERLLKGMTGVVSSTAITPDRLQICYSVEELTLKTIESALREVGFDLDDTLFTRIKRAMLCYCEDALRASRGVFEFDGYGVPQLAISRLPLQDPRRHNWRRFI